MSEYSEKHTSSSLVGAPAGYIGYSEGGILTNAVRKNPFSVVLFDEIEKAHPDVFNLLLQIIQDGILTDNVGRQISFKNTIIVLTSNLGNDSISELEYIGFKVNKPTQNDSKNELHKFYQSQLTDFLSTEILGRINEIVVFNELSDNTVRELISKQMQLMQKHFTALGFKIKFDDLDRVKQLIFKKYDSKEGARSINKIINREIFSKIINFIQANPDTNTINLSSKNKINIIKSKTLA